MRNIRSLRLLGILVLGAAVLFFYFTGTSGEAVTIIDNDLREAVKQAAGRPFGAITTSDLKKITTLKIAGSEDNPVTVTDLSVLAYCDNITHLSIENNTGKIEDFSPLAGLSDFRELSLINCNLTDISTLSSLKGLLAINLSNNQITDISPLLVLPDLDSCYLYGNPLDERSLHEYLPKLTETIDRNDFDEILRDDEASGE